MRGGFGPPFFCSSADAAPFGAPVGVAVRKWWRGRLPPAAPCGGRGLGWRAPPPALLDPPASPPPTAGRACAPPCGGRRLALAAAAIIQWGGGAAAARPLWGGAPLSGGCGGACRAWGLLSWRRRGLGRSAPLHSKPPAPPRPQSPPPCACRRGVGVPLAAASGDGRPLSRAGLILVIEVKHARLTLVHLNILHQPNKLLRYAAYAAGFYRRITRNLRIWVSYHKKLVTLARLQGVGSTTKGVILCMT